MSECKLLSCQDLLTDPYSYSLFLACVRFKSLEDLALDVVGRTGCGKAAGRPMHQTDIPLPTAQIRFHLSGDGVTLAAASKDPWRYMRVCPRATDHRELGCTGVARARILSRRSEDKSIAADFPHRCFDLPSRPFLNGRRISLFPDELLHRG